MFQRQRNNLRGAAVLVVGAAALTLTLVACAAPASGSGAQTGAALWQANCGVCHNFRSPAEFSDGQWEVIVQHMRVRANLPAADARAIEELLKSSN